MSMGDDGICDDSICDDGICDDGICDDSICDEYTEDFSGEEQEERYHFIMRDIEGCVRDDGIS